MCKHRVWVLSVVLAACGSRDAQGPEGRDPVEIAVAEQGAAIAGCENDGFADGLLTLDVNGDSMVLSAIGGKITANGYTCTGLIQNLEQPLTTTNIKKILIRGSGSEDTVILDMLPGSFGPRILSNSGGIVVDFAATSGGADSFMIRGSATTQLLIRPPLAGGILIRSIQGD